jgi:hypothetical protein
MWRRRRSPEAPQKQEHGVAFKRSRAHARFCSFNYIHNGTEQLNIEQGADVVVLGMEATTSILQCRRCVQLFRR